jgi:nitric oxide reductase NorQ protein
MNNKAKLIVGTTSRVAGTPMILGVPTKSGHDVYMRFYTGNRGRGAAWSKVESLKDLPPTPIANIVDFNITDQDKELAEIGKITSINVKAMAALDKSPTMPHAEALGSGLYDFNIQEGATKYFGEVSVKAEIPSPESSSDQAYVLASVPNKEWADTYINRKIVGDLTEFDIYEVAMRKHENILVTGPAGSGKTMSVLAYAASRGLRYYNVSSHNGVEPTQLFGRWVPTTTGSFRWQDGPVTDLVKHGGVLLINEVNFMPERTKTVLFSLLDKRREIQLMDKDGEMIKAHPELLIISDMNPNYRGTKPLNEAEKDRYAHKIDFPYDITIEETLISSKTLRNVADRLRKAHDREELHTPISTRSLVAFCENVESLGIDYAIYSFLNGFSESERSAVKLTMDTDMYQLKRDFDVNDEINYQSDEFTLHKVDTEWLDQIAKHLPTDNDEVSQVQL